MITIKEFTIDIETKSDKDISKCGVYAYADSPYFDILLFAYSVDGQPVQVIDTASGEKIPAFILSALADEKIIKRAFNVNFERVCLSRYLQKNYPQYFQSYSINEDTVGNYLNPEGWQYYNTPIYTKSRKELILMGIFAGLFKSRDKPQNSYDSPSYTYFFGRANSGKRVTDRTALQHIAVYACVRVLSEAIAQLPLHVYKYNDKGKERVPQHPLYFLLHDQPNPEMTSFVFRETLMSHLLIYGNAYAQIIRNGRGDVIGLYPLMPDKMKVDRDNKNRLIYIYSRYDEANPNLKEQGDIILYADEVLHIPGLGFDGLVGYSPIALAKNAIGISIACEEYGASFFGNGASPSGVLEHPGVIKNPERVRDAWQRAYGGRNAHKVAVLEEGMKFTPIAIPNNEAQFLETRKFQIEEIARLYRVPLHMIGDLDHATFSNVEHLSLDFVKYSLDPWIVRWEQSLQKSLLSDSEKGQYFIKFNVDGLLRGDYASRMQGYATARQNGWMSANDIREMEDMNMIPAEEGGDLYLCNGSFTKLSEAGAFANQKPIKEEETE